MSMYSYCMFMSLHRASWHSSATLSEVFPCFFLSCKANARVKPAKMGHGPHSSKLYILFYVLSVLCRYVYSLCVNAYCTTATGWLPNLSPNQTISYPQATYLLNSQFRHNLHSFFSIFGVQTFQQVAPNLSSPSFFYTYYITSPFQY
jgi:hypothetical protein